VTAKLTKDRLKHICYVEVELESLSEDKSIVRGLFLGVQPLVGTSTQLVSKDELFLWVARGDQINTCNLYSFKINSIEIAYKVVINGTTFVDRFSDLQQKDYLEQLDVVTKLMEEENKVIGDGLIDVEFYNEVPADLKKSVSVHTESKAGAHTPPASRHACGYKGTAGTGTTYYKKEVSTTAIKRTTKYPITSAVEQMKAKVQAIREGSYEPPDIPEPAEVKDTKNTTTPYDEDDDMFTYGYGIA